MIATKTETSNLEFVVIHPLFDVAEDKHSGEGLGLMKISPSVRICLLVLRA
jgi:hypothetical protein